MISIVIPCYNNLEYTIGCIHSIRKNTPPIEYEIILVDNGSTDGTREWACAQSDIIYHREEKNLGFGPAINDGMILAKGNQIVWLNNDTIVTPKWAEQMLDCLSDADVKLHCPKVGLVGPASNHAIPQQCVGMEVPLNRLDEFASRFRQENYDNWIYVPSLSGFCLMISRECYEAVGPVDDKTFPGGGFEDNDYCVRAIQAGFAPVIAGDTFVYHHPSMTMTKFFDPLMWQKNEVPFYDKHFKLLPKEQKLIFIYRVKILNELNRKHLVMSLRKSATLADEILILDDGSTTPWEGEQIDGCPISMRRYTREFDEYRDRWELIQWAKEEGASWVVSIDSDEVFEPKVTKESFTRLMNMPNPQIFSFGFPFRTLWDREDQFLVDSTTRGAHFRMYKVLPGQKLMPGSGKGLHCGNIPYMPVGSGCITNLKVLHYGYVDPEERLRKYNFYQEIDKEKDPTLVGGVDYRHLITRNITLAPLKLDTKLSLCMIGKNEENQMAGFLTRFWSMADEFCYVDTGSTDRSLNITKMWGAKTTTLPISEGFAAARNKSKSMASGNWIWQMDWDEEIEEQSFILFPTLLELDSTGFVFEVENRHRDGKMNITEITRLFRNIPELVYQGNVHEQIDRCWKALRGKVKVTQAPIKIIHNGYLKDPAKLQKKWDFYKKICEREAELNPKDPLPFYSLALYLINERGLKSLRKAEELLLRSAINDPEFYQAKHELAVVYLRLAQHWASQGAQLVPDSFISHKFLKRVSDFVTKLIGE